MQQQYVLFFFFGKRLESCCCVREIRAGKRDEMLRKATPVLK